MLSSKPSLHPGHREGQHTLPGSVTGGQTSRTTGRPTENATHTLDFTMTTFYTPPPHQGIARRALAYLLMLFALGICLDSTGCGTAQSSISPDVVVAPDGKSTLALWADWDDVDASVGSGMTPAEAATLNTTSADDRRTWSLLTIDNHTGELVVTREPGAPRDARGCERLTLSAQIDGTQGKTRAGLMVSGIAKRLTQLAGVEWAPRR